MAGKVSLIGAGIGDPELLTRKAWRKIREADVVIYDRLINPAILHECSATCQKIYVGKQPTFHPIPQAEIEAILVTEAQAGKNVVRLKSGDPYVFGRGGEEGSRLRAAGIEFEVIPGVTSAIAGLAYAGIPITHREHAASFHVYTGHLKSAENQIDWQTAAQAEGTLVFLMGMSELATITKELTAYGKDPQTPAAIIQWASRRQQKTVTGTLATIYDLAQQAQLQPPSLIVIGGVVRERAALNFFEERPLFNISVALPYTEGKGMASRLTDLGAEVMELAKPTITFYQTALDLATERELVFLDKNSVAVFVQEMQRQQLDWRHLGGVQLTTIGHHTKLALEAQGIIPDHAYVTALDFAAIGGAAAALYLGAEEQLQALAAQVPTHLRTVVTHQEVLSAAADPLWASADFLYFPSSKAARLFLNSLTATSKKALQQKRIVVMGAVTAQVFAAEQIPVIVSAEATYDSVIQEILKENSQ